MHRGVAVKEWLHTQPEFRDTMLFQPPYSPDLNPIEHVWARMKRKLSDKIYGTTPLLTQAILEAWQEIERDREFLRALTLSMPRRLDAVITAGGGPTKY